MTQNHQIIDSTDVSADNSLEETLRAIERALGSRVNCKAEHIATSSSHMTEQRKPFITIVNGVLKTQGDYGDTYVLKDDFSSSAQIEAFQMLAERQYQGIIAYKPPEVGVVIWRQQNECRRALYANGLHLQIYCRLAWEKLRG